MSDLKELEEAALLTAETVGLIMAVLVKKGLITIDDLIEYAKTEEVRDLLRAAEAIQKMKLAD
jgi:Mg/Co/Ni transporter MgtE